jgi:chromosome segregation ATPase
VLLPCSELKNYVSKSTKEKETESKRLRDQLAEEEHKRRQYEQEMVHHQSRFAQLEAQKRDAELRAKEESLRDVQAREDEARRLKRELDEMKRRTAEIEDEKRSLERRLQMEERQKQSSDALKIQLEDMRIKAAEMELQQMGLELKVQEQAEARAFAEAAARDAARAAELSARAAIEAAGFSSRDDVRRKRYLSGGSEDVDMEEEEEALPPARAPGESVACCYALCGCWFPTASVYSFDPLFLLSAVHGRM